MPDNARPLNSPERLLTTSRAALVFVLLTVFIDSLGFGIIIPSMAPVIMELTDQPESIAVGWNGYLMAVYALLQFFMAPIFGNLSDRIGRRPVLLWSLAAFGVDFLLTGLATSMTWLFIGRAVAGIFGASFAAAGGLHRRHQQRGESRPKFRLHRRRLGFRLHARPGHRRLCRRTFRSARAVLRRRRAGAGQRDLRLFRTARVAATRAAPQVRMGARQSFRGLQEPGPSAHGGGTVVRGVPLPGGARFAAGGVDVLHPAASSAGPAPTSACH